MLLAGVEVVPNDRHGPWRQGDRVAVVPPVHADAFSLYVEP